MFAKQKEFTEDTVELKRSGALGHWIGSRRARNVLVYYHGTFLLCFMRFIFLTSFLFFLLFLSLLSPSVPEESNFLIYQTNDTKTR